MRALLVCDQSECPTCMTRLAQFLRCNGHEVSTTNPCGGVTAIIKNRPDVVLIATWDIVSLPALLLRVQQLYAVNQMTGRHPVVIAITNQESSDLDSLYNIGFDIVAKTPLYESVLLAQMMAMDRRLGISCRTLSSPHLLIDLHTHEVYIKASHGTLLASLSVGQIQFVLLKCFLQFPQRVWKRLELLQYLSVESESQRMTESLDVRVVDGNIYRLRRAVKTAMESIPIAWYADPNYKEIFFHTERSGGYFFLDTMRLEGEGRMEERTLGIAHLHPDAGAGGGQGISITTLPLIRPKETVPR